MAEQIIIQLWEAEVELARGKSFPELVRKLCMTEQSYYRDVLPRFSLWKWCCLRGGRSTAFHATVRTAREKSGFKAGLRQREKFGLERR